VSRRILVFRGVFVVAVLAVGAGVMMPTRVWVNQQQQISAAEQQLQTLEDHNAELATRVEKLKSSDEVEYRAGEEFGWVRPGDELYTSPPAPPPSISLPDRWPFNLVSDALQQVGRN
jgi:cell division protein FtsB